MPVSILIPTKVSVLPKSKCKLKSGPFEATSEVDVDWRDGRGRKERLVATILKVGDKGKHFLCGRQL